MTSASDWVDLGQRYFERNYYGKALEHFREASAADPNSADAWNACGVALKFLRRFEEAMADYEQALLVDPNCYKAWYNKGLLLEHLQRGSYQAILSCHQTALEINPTFQSAQVAYDRIQQLLQPDALEHRAYQEAGQAVLSHLIRYGYIKVTLDDKVFWVDEITIVGYSDCWEQLTFSLTSLITNAYILLAGYVAEQIRYPDYPDHQEGLPLEHPLVALAKLRLQNFLSHYASDTPEAEVQVEKDAIEGVNRTFGIVKEALQPYWSSIEAVANALLQNKTLPGEFAENLLRKTLPPEISKTSA